MYRVVKADAPDWTSLNGVMTDGTVEPGDKDVISAHLLGGSHVCKKSKPIWRLTPSADDGSTPHSSHQPQSSTSGIKPTEMMHVAINYGGLPGLAYVKSVDEFVSEIHDPLLQEVVARRCDLLTDRVYSIGLLFKEQQQERQQGGQRPADQQQLDKCLAVIDEQDKDGMVANNDTIIEVLSCHDTDDDTQQRLLKKLRQQLAILTSS